MKWYFNETTGNFAIDKIPTKEVEGEMVEEDGWIEIPSRPEPYDNYIFDGAVWVEKATPKLVPKTITPRQFKLQLLEISLLDKVEALCAEDKVLEIWFKDSQDIQRDNPLIVSFAEKFNLTDEELDTFFIEANLR